MLRLVCDEPHRQCNLLISLVLFPRHLTTQRREDVVSHIQTFRDYFHYHIKASKVSPGVQVSC
jgi:hypothetical protein